MVFALTDERCTQHNTNLLLKPIHEEGCLFQSNFVRVFGLQKQVANVMHCARALLPALGTVYKAVDYLTTTCKT